MIITLEETKQWLRVDGDEEDAVITLLINSAEGYLKTAVDRVFDSTNGQAKHFCLVLVTDWYENREMIGDQRLVGSSPSERVRYSIQSMLLQLQNAAIEGVEIVE